MSTGRNCSVRQDTQRKKYIRLLDPTVKPGSSRTQICDDYPKANMFSVPIRSPHTFEVGAWFWKPSFNKHTYCWGFTNHHKRDTGSAVLHNMHCGPQSGYDTAQRNFLSRPYFAKYGRDKKLPEMKFNGLIDTCPYILCHITFLGVKVPPENFNVRAIAVSSKTGQLRTVT